jgi:hypothetical protein
MDFFTEDDILLLHENSEQEYRDTHKARTAQQELAAGAWAKTKHWAELAAGDEFEVSYRTSVVRRAGKKKAVGGKPAMLRRFRAYTWARLFRPGDEAYKVFFTVGVDGGKQQLVWKLDCMREGAKALDRRQLDRFYAYQDKFASATKWKSVPIAEVLKWNWKKLVAETKRFMTENEDVYQEAIRQTWAGHEPGQDKLARLCWNDYGWQRPSGPAGKSRIRGVHEAGGWGAEEWLFDFARLLDGYRYAYLTPIRGGAEKHAGAVYNIRLYSHNGLTGEYFHVGRLRNAEFLSETQIDEATTRFHERKWLRDMGSELLDAGIENEMATDAVGPFNIRFRPGDVERPNTSDGMELIEDISEWTDGHHYVLLEDVRAEEGWDKKGGGGGQGDDDEDDEDATDDDDELDLKADAVDKYKGLRKRRIRPAVIELPSLHDQVQDNLMHYLKKRYPKQLVGSEVSIKRHGTRIDVVRQRPDKSYVFYEVKVLPTLRACIREALGQLLEYAHWPAKKTTAELVIVSHHESDPQTAGYLAKLGEVYGLTIGYLRIGIEAKPIKASK